MKQNQPQDFGVSIVPEMCECGRLYINARNKNGKMMCVACYTGLELEDLKKLWGTPVPEKIKDIFKGQQKC